MELVEATKLTVYVGDADRHGRKPLYRAVVELLYREGIAGATVLHGVEGFGLARRIHTIRILDLSTDLPVMVIAIDRTEKIELVLSRVQALVPHGVVTLERVGVALSRLFPL